VVFAGIAALAGVGLVVSTFVPGVPLLPDGAVVPLSLVVAIPLFVWAVVERAAERASRPRRKWNDFSGITDEDYNRGWGEVVATVHRLRHALVVAVPVLVGLWIEMLISVASAHGEPEHQGGSY
jgi:hypothetical protein